MRRNSIECPTTSQPVAMLPWRDTGLNNRTTRFEHRLPSRASIVLKSIAPSCVTFQTAYILVIDSKRYGTTKNAENSILKTCLTIADPLIWLGSHTGTRELYQGSKVTSINNRTIQSVAFPIRFIRLRHRLPRRTTQQTRHRSRHLQPHLPPPRSPTVLHQA